jgi:gamma-glutamylcyclotransferase (GGCT)/AIG2-like uncharacterized protein YtfP
MFQISSEAVVTEQAPIHQVAVYGTLKRGYINHHYLAGARFIGQDMLCSIILYDLGEYPGAKPGASQGVLVEVYCVSDAMMSVLDDLEECYFDAPAKGLYRRELVETRHGAAWLYLYNPEIELGRIFAGRCW